MDFVYVVIPSVVPIDQLIGDLTIFTIFEGDFFRLFAYD